MRTFFALQSREAVRRAISTLIRLTPRESGWAVSNWIVTVGLPFEGTVGSKDSVSFSAQQSSIAGLGTYRDLRQQIYVTNNVPYVGRLNAGSSTKTPAGFVQAAVVSAVRAAR